MTGPSALVHTVRFGSGVPTQPKSRPAPARVGRPRRWPRVLANLLLTAVILGGVTFFVISRLHDPLQVTGVTLTVNKHFGKQCELDADVVGTINTSGGPGVLTYQWRRSDGTATDVYTARIGGSSTETIVHLHWVFRGTGQETADVTLSILGPEANEATTSFNYICAG